MNQVMRRGLGLYGGSFNPVHRGHLELARRIRDRLQLEKVIFIPNALPPHKEAPGLDYDTRTGLLSLALDGETDRFPISRIESDPTIRHYTYDTVSLLRRKFGSDLPLCFLIGMDSLIDLDTWHRGLELTDFVNLAVLGRPGYALASALQKPLLGDYLHPRLEEVSADAPAGLPPCGKVFLLPETVADLSSTTLRALLSRHPDSLSPEEANFLRLAIPAPVLAEIRQRKLYARGE